MLQLSEVSALLKLRHSGGGGTSLRVLSESVMGKPEIVIFVTTQIVFL